MQDLGAKQKLLTITPVKVRSSAKVCGFLMPKVGISSQAPEFSLNPLVFIPAVLAMILIFACIFAHANSPLYYAQQEIGHGEIGGNNQGIYVRQYLNGQENLPWCAGFISYCIRKSDIKKRYTLRAKDYLTMGLKVSDPQPENLIIFTRKGGGHVGIIEKITQTTITTIEGNVGDYPAKVKRVIYQKNNIKNLLGFIKLQ